LEDGLEEECDDDLVELNSLQVVFICMGSDKKKKAQKRRKTSTVWNFFHPLPSTGQSDNKQRAKCKLCGATYLAPDAYAIGNLRRHMKTCSRRDTRNVGKMLISGNGGSMSVSASKFCAT
jgi:hypothetical protein